MRPDAASWMMPSPPSASTVAHPSARSAISEACRGPAVFASTTASGPSAARKSVAARSAAAAPAPFWAAGFAMSRTFPSRMDMPAPFASAASIPCLLAAYARTPAFTVSCSCARCSSSSVH